MGSSAAVVVVYRAPLTGSQPALEEESSGKRRELAVEEPGAWGHGDQL